MIETIRNAEYGWFLWLNGFHSPFWDSIMFAVTHRLTWIPLYVFIIFYLFTRLRPNAFYKLVFILAAVGLSDRITSGLMKPYFARFRPCHDPTIGHLVHVVGGCGGQYGFASSHAANSFALMLAFILICPKNIKWKYFLIPWAILVSYSRIYVGVHYPTDLLAGALVGMLTTLIIYLIINQFNQSLLSETK
ncbi:phosphatase PAP2 family protein [Emticicia sp. 21SJ11W-3]|uniref:phosphatase PAP2 family protein n=1 Tax=Emticicia sp. 21SJ11W-3 TaxID=2916755 RepID=UPI0020A173DE|nr:phosphatase PAP2 family protein [Emticicia sp. 21SJ11W-3]UTA70272.1 phosphatase PAP2 family protein [Emticicia sp. 21SJ11W-3]